MPTKKASPDRKPVEPQTALELLKSALWYMQSARFAVMMVPTSRGFAIVIPGIATNETGELMLSGDVLPVVAKDKNTLTQTGESAIL